MKRRSFRGGGSVETKFNSFMVTFVTAFAGRTDETLRVRLLDSSSDLRTAVYLGEARFGETRPYGSSQRPSNLLLRSTLRDSCGPGILLSKSASDVATVAKKFLLF